MTNLAYQFEDSLSDRAARRKGDMLGQMLKACAVLCAILGDTLQSLEDRDISC